MIRSLLILSMLLGAFWAQAETPVTGRVQTMLFSPAEIQAVAVAAYREELARLASQNELDTDPRLLVRVRNVSARLIAQAILLKPDAANWPWEIHVTANKEITAYARAGGKLLVGSEFVAANRFSDGELAVLLAHEIAHVIAEHVREQVSLAASFDPPPPNRQLQMQEVINDMDSDIAVYLRLLPLSRLQELEADDIGIELAARAGIPAKTIAQFYQKIVSDEAGQSLFDTHGAPQQRQAFVQGMLGYVSAEYQEFATQARPVYSFR